MTMNTWVHDAFSPLAIDEEVMAAEFRVATYRAIDNNEHEFNFYGQIVEVNDAIEVIDAYEDGRIYH